MAHPQFTGLLFPQTPTPVETKYTNPIPVKLATHKARMKHHHHQVGVFCSTIPHILLVTQWKFLLFSTRGGSIQGAGLTFFRMAGASFWSAVFAVATVSALSRAIRYDHHAHRGVLLHDGMGALCHDTRG